MLFRSSSVLSLLHSPTLTSIHDHTEDVTVSSTLFILQLLNFSLPQKFLSSLTYSPHVGDLLSRLGIPLNQIIFAPNVLNNISPDIYHIDFQIFE